MGVRDSPAAGQAIMHLEHLGKTCLLLYLLILGLESHCLLSETNLLLLSMPYLLQMRIL